MLDNHKAKQNVCPVEKALQVMWKQKKILAVGAAKAWHSRRDEGGFGFHVQLYRWHNATGSRTELLAWAEVPFSKQSSCGALGDTAGRYQLLVQLKPAAQLALQLAE